MRTHLAVTGIGLLFLAIPAWAQRPDAWSQLAEKSGAFSPHTNNCASTESFVAVGGSTLGFCIDQGLQSASTWENAKETCATAGKRLPEPAEYKFACDRASSLGISNMPGQWEWASNDPSLFMVPGSGTIVYAIGAGDIACYRGAYGIVMGNPAGYTPPDQFQFRCVR